MVFLIHTELRCTVNHTSDMIWKCMLLAINMLWVFFRTYSKKKVKKVKIQIWMQQRKFLIICLVLFSLERREYISNYLINIFTSVALYAFVVETFVGTVRSKALILLRKWVTFLVVYWEQHFRVEMCVCGENSHLISNWIFTRFNAAHVLWLLADVRSGRLYCKCIVHNCATPTST